MTFTSKRKQDEIDADEVRTHQVKVMLNSSELKFLDTVRGSASRAEAVRYILLGSTPAPSVPELNSLAWQELARASANLNQLAHRTNVGEVIKLDELREALEAFRERLIGA